LAPEIKPSLSARISVRLQHLRGILVSFWFWLFSKLRAPSQNPHQSIQPQGDAQAKTKNSKQELTQSGGAGKSDLPPTNTKKKKSHCGCACFLRWGNFVIQVLIFLAASVYGGIAWNQWHTQIRNMRIDERPWIAMQDLEEHIRQPQSDKFFRTTPTFINVGKTPALDIVARANYKILPVGQTLTPNDIKYRNDSRGEKESNSTPAGTLNPTERWTPRFYFEQIDLPTWDELMCGDKRFYVFFQVTYEDVFGRKLETDYCTYYAGGGLAPPMVPCDIYNGTTHEPHR
jgi:hypothetical protein